MCMEKQIQQPNRRERRQRIELRYDVEIRDKDGNLISKESRRSRSLLTNFVKILATFLSAPWNAAGSAQSITDTGNQARTVPTATASAEGQFWGWNAPAGTITYGMVIGIGTGTIAPSDYQLWSIIAHGSNPTQMVYAGQSYEAVAVVGLVSSIRATRTFTNNSGSTITVQEIGWICTAYDSGNVQRYVLMIHDLLISPQAVPSGATLTLRYTFSATA